MQDVGLVAIYVIVGAFVITIAVATVWLLLDLFKDFLSSRK